MIRTAQRAIAASAVACLWLGAGVIHAAPSTATEPAASDPIAKYFTELAAMKLVDTESGNLDTLRKELGIAEQLLRDGAFANAAIALYSIVKSPRYAAFQDFVEFQNAEYDLGVSLARAGSYGAALAALEAVLRRGPAAPYWGPAHRRMVDVALETRDHAGVLARLEATPPAPESIDSGPPRSKDRNHPTGGGPRAGTADPIPPSAAGERSYLRGRAAYDAGKLADAEAELLQISRQSRLYSSAVYLRGVIRARQGKFKDSAEAMCEIAATEDTDRFTFVVDERYFTIKDLARLGLGRIAHEMGEYDDAYYHYFQIPDDSAYLSDALFEASWSMYQKRELATARDLVKEFLATFPSSPLWPEASLLAGYVELADCKFDASQTWYDELTAKLSPIVEEIDKVRKDPELRKQLLAIAITRFHEVKETGEVAGQKPGKAAAKPVSGTAPGTTPGTTLTELAALLRLDPRFLRLSDAVTGTHEQATTAPAVVRAWQHLARTLNETKVSAVSTGKTIEQEQLADANALVEDMRRLVTQIREQKSELARARREGVLTASAAGEEQARLDKLLDKARSAEQRAIAAADRAAEATTTQAQPSLRPMLQDDLNDARRLDKASHALLDKLEQAGDRLAQQAVDKLYADTRRVLDKAKLGKVDAIIGQKRKLDIEVQDLAAGRFPAELIGKLWNASMIGDDEEYWPWQGEYWADEYEGWR
ncbi:MAG TPA: tetratricopeptide repeat protein [Kofleriaceae bacterium]|jgi:TolA-binding protein|nr:tetratricopeptide repeat protein [Kofleriaceae bacterium]